MTGCSELNPSGNLEGQGEQCSGKPDRIWFYRGNWEGLLSVRVVYSEPVPLGRLLGQDIGKSFSRDALHLLALLSHLPPMDGLLLELLIKKVPVVFLSPYFNPRFSLVLTSFLLHPFL